MSRAATAYICSRQVQKVPPPACVRPRSARWKAWECASANAGSPSPSSDDVAGRRPDALVDPDHQAGAVPHPHPGRDPPGGWPAQPGRGEPVGPLGAGRTGRRGGHPRQPVPARSRMIRRARPRRGGRRRPRRARPGRARPRTGCARRASRWARPPRRGPRRRARPRGQARQQRLPVGAGPCTGCGERRPDRTGQPGAQPGVEPRDRRPRLAHRRRRRARAATSATAASTAAGSAPRASSQNVAARRDRVTAPGSTRTLPTVASTRAARPRGAPPARRPANASIGSVRSASGVVPAWLASPTRSNRQRPCGQISVSRPSGAPASARPTRRAGSRPAAVPLLDVQLHGRRRSAASRSGSAPQAGRVRADPAARRRPR